MLSTRDDYYPLNCFGIKIIVIKCFKFLYENFISL